MCGLKEEGRREGGAQRKNSTCAGRGRAKGRRLLAYHTFRVEASVLSTQRGVTNKRRPGHCLAVLLTKWQKQYTNHRDSKTHLPALSPPRLENRIEKPDAEFVL